MATPEPPTKQDEKVSQVADDIDSDGNLIYTDADEEPELSSRTYIALASMFLLHFVQIMALQGPPVVLSFIAHDLNATPSATWIPNALSLVQAVLGPPLSSASDTFQARKTLLITSCLLSFIGSALAPGAQSFARFIVATVLIGVGFAAVPLGYCVPSEVVPRKWYPVVQGVMNVGVIASSIASPLSIGALERDEVGGWRKFYWIQMALWGVSAIGIQFGYNPPKRHTQLDHLSFWQKLGHLDLPGFFLLTAGLTLFLVALGLGGAQRPWGSAQVLGTLVTGMITLITFGLYEWKGTKTGILHHELFKGGRERGRTFALCAVLIFIEGILLFSFTIFYPVMTTNLFTAQPFQIPVRSQPFWVCAILSSITFGYLSTKFRTIRLPLFIGFLFFTAAIIGLATIQPSQSTSALVFAGLAGLGFGPPLVLIIAATQLAVPHYLIATAVSVVTSARSVASTVFVASFQAGYTGRLARLVPAEVTPAVLAAGLPNASVPAFLRALTAKNETMLEAVQGVTPAVIGAGMTAYRQAEADSLRVVYEIAAPFGVVACVLVVFMGRMRDLMDYKIDAPLEELRRKGGGGGRDGV